MSAQVPDSLFREKYLTALLDHMRNVADFPTERLPAPRVIAVDAPWGHGKTWLAQKLKSKLESSDPPHRVVSIDAFRFDHHSDAFAVIAAAIYRELNPKGEVKKRFIRATGEVLKSSTPALVKAAVRLGLGMINLDEEKLDAVKKQLLDDAVDAAGDLSVSGVEALLNTYAENAEAQDGFLRMFQQLTEKLPQPLVVIVDELDRCRPSFALEMLERIKHLFSANNVLFVLFWNSQAIHESIRHSYGQNIDAQQYLAKFVALTVPLSIKGEAPRNVKNVYEAFILQELSRNDSADSLRLPEAEIADALAIYAVAFSASLRDLKATVSLCRHPILVREMRQLSMVFSLLLLLKAKDESFYRQVVSLDGQALTRVAEALHPQVVDPDTSLFDLWQSFRYLSSPSTLDKELELSKNQESPRAREVAAIVQSGKRLRHVVEQSARRLREVYGVA